ncbi:MAG: 8-oxo-dGTP diphosphatase [Lachnospiraceae bacterium]|nr:8-oxo-dGTP diphosphatase [Lachnospiraceae bacterium]
MKLTTLCYLEKDGCYLMLLRDKKENDENRGKWIGVGGKFEPGESPEDCLIREVREETGLVLQSARFRGIVTFVSDLYGTEYMHLFTSPDFSGEPVPCEEGELAWIPLSEILSLDLWEGDRLFLKLLAEDAGFFSLKLVYEGDRLVSSVLKRYDGAAGRPESPSEEGLDTAALAE